MKVKIPPDVMKFFQRTGSIGGKKAARNMTAKELSRRGKKAVMARERYRKQRSRPSNGKQQ